MKYAPLLQMLLSGESASVTLASPNDLTVEVAMNRIRTGLRRALVKAGAGSDVVAQVSTDGTHITVALARKSQFEDEFTPVNTDEEEE